MNILHGRFAPDSRKPIFAHVSFLLDALIFECGVYTLSFYLRWKLDSMCHSPQNMSILNSEDFRLSHLSCLCDTPHLLWEA